MLKYVLLGFLNYRPMTGYDLKQTINRSTIHFWHAELSQIYVTLKMLEKDGLIESEVQEQSQRPDRRVYTITDAGRRYLHEWLSLPLAELSPRKETLLLKLFFAAQLDKQALLAQLHLQRELYVQHLAMIRGEMAQEIVQSAEAYPVLEQDALLWEATRRFGELNTQATLQWLDETLELIDEHF
jgi:PadR family transcriptional regulator AphA